MPAITIRAVQELATNSVLWDDAVRGFGVRRQTRDAFYVIKYRIFGRQRFVTIGRHGSPWTPDTARREARRLLGVVASGQDPAHAKATEWDQATETLGKVAEAYLDWAEGEQRPGSFVETKRHLLANWKPLHGVSVFHLRRRQVATQLREIETKHGRRTSLQARAHLSAMFNWAIREGYELAGNPVTGTNRPSTKARERVLSPEELASVWRACDDSPYGRIVRLLILTGQRRDEVGLMTWEEIKDGMWTIPKERTKNKRTHTVPLPILALSFMGVPNKSGLVFASRNWWPNKKRLDAKAALARPFILHDIRRSVATGMAEIGILPHIIEAVLNHVSGHRAGIAGVYNRARYADEVRDALHRWAAHVSALVGAHG